MGIEIQIALISLGGVFLGSALTILGNYIQKRQERNTEIHKVLTQKRVEAYEAIMASVKHCIIAVGVWKDNEFIKYPQIFTNAEQFDQWYVQFGLINRSVAHLIDKKLAYKLHIFNNYLVNLNDRLDYFRDENGQFWDNKKAQLFGAILYEDFRKLTSDILAEASKFYSSGIYRHKFEPSTLDESESDLPEDFIKFALFSKNKEMHKLLNE